MSGFEVSVAAAVRSSSATAEAAAALRAMLTDLLLRIEDVVESRWRGEAAAAFARACAQWRAAAEDVCRALADLADALLTTARAYLDADSVGAELLRAAA